MKNIYFFLLLFLVSCKAEVKLSGETNDSLSVVDSVINYQVEDQEDSLVLKSTKLECSISSIDKLKFIVDSSLLFDRQVSLISVSNKDSISKFKYINNFFDIDLIDSIEFYGTSVTNFMRKQYLPMNSLVILYSSSNEFSRVSFDSLNSWTKSSSRAIERMFKPGGIAFDVNDNVCLFSINACGPGIEKVNEIDSIIKTNIFNIKPYKRLISGCGMHKFIEKNN
jgi:hypothetical protein